MSKVKVDQELPKPPTDERDWAGLHPDALMVIFDKVGMHEVLLRTSKVCHPWRKAARDDPLLWKVIDMSKKCTDCFLNHEFDCIEATVKVEKGLANVVKNAVNFGGNNVQQLSIGYFSDEDLLENLLEYIAERVRLLKNISIDCFTFNERMAMALGNLKQLEELTIVWSRMPLGFVMRAIGAECPQLKCLKLESPFNRGIYNNNKSLRNILGIPQTMLQLKCLQLAVSCITTTNEELLKILEMCPNLEVLDLRNSFKIALSDDDIRARCSRIHTVLPPPDDINNGLYVDDDDDSSEDFGDPYDYIYGDDEDDYIHDYDYDEIYDFNSRYDKYFYPWRYDNDI
ncbi:F-BOX WITH WD-40 2 [Rhynchospora pubera]|uniref:F-BOX WITH WD-40 2 n=1 Tax=Rhynchospora pubera TaxID=906938 RepID=A0AAV8H128_9POAL|nr:F-BOX WITH WD-40 2 [Rhynchospora pubera]